MKKILAFTCIVLVTACAMTPTPKSDYPADVTFQFKSYNDDSALTFWRKIESNGGKGDRFSIGGASRTALMMNMGFSSFEPVAQQLDPGTYFLDSFQASSSVGGAGGFCLSESGHYMFRNGWDDANNKPLYLSFSVEEGQKLTLPMVQFDENCNASFSDPEKIFTVGEKLNRK